MPIVESIEVDLYRAEKVFLVEKIGASNLILNIVIFVQIVCTLTSHLMQADFQSSELISASICITLGTTFQSFYVEF